jgi:hypothetical protein
MPALAMGWRVVLELVTPSSFCRHVYGVIFTCSEKQVVWVYANRIIATMANHHPIGDLAMFRKPHCSMCELDSVASLFF